MATATTSFPYRPWNWNVYMECECKYGVRSGFVVEVCPLCGNDFHTFKKVKARKVRNPERKWWQFRTQKYIWEKVYYN